MSREKGHDELVDEEYRERVDACVAFCEGAPLEALIPGGLMKSFKELTPGGGAFEVMTIAVEHQRVKAENIRLQEQLNSFNRTQPELILRVKELEAENTRLKAGDFTPEEFQNICHKYASNMEGPERFCDGCEEYHKKVFGWSPITKLKEENVKSKERIAWLEQYGIECGSSK